MSLDTRPAARARPARGAPHEVRRPRVLVLDGDDAERRRTHAALHEAGFAVFGAADAEEAWDLVGVVDALVCDPAGDHEALVPLVDALAPGGLVVLYTRTFAFGWASRPTVTVLKGDEPTLMRVVAGAGRSVPPAAGLTA
jgi:hypothetical protein